MTAAIPAVERISARKGSLGEGMEIARALPTRGRRMIGAWCFLDHLGPIVFPDGQGMHVGAHPHTRLQTFTWMIEGEILHRDSLGSEQIIRPGQVNLMTAGHGISHTEDSVTPGARLHAAQLWIALPDAVAEQAPSFAHYANVPHWQEQGCAWSLMAGSYGSYSAPTALHSPLMGLEVLGEAGG
ncbi:MAG TPA: pirin family protein, partial [Comamonas sp.]